MSQWPMVKLGDVCERKIPKWDRNGKKKYIDISTVSPETKKVESPQDVLGEDAPSRAQQIIQTDDVLVSTVRPNLNAVAKIPSTFNGHIASTGFCVLRATEKIDPGFLFHFVQTQAFIQQCINKSTGISYPSTTANKIRAIQIPLPPLEEQRRIASILGHSTLQNSIVNKTINKLNTARQGCIEKYVDDPSKTPRLDSLADLQGGLSLGKTREVNPVEVEYLRVANIQRNNLILDNLKTIQCTEKELERCTIKDGDILMLEANANPLEVGRAAVAKVGSRHLVFQNHLFRVRSTEVSPIVLNALLSSVSVRTQLLRLAKTTSGLNTMTISQARALRIPLRDELTTKEFERQLTRIEQQKKFLAEKQSLLEELHQSLATRAFAGQL